MAEQPTVTGTEVSEDGASRIVRKLDSIEKKLTVLLWLIALPVVYAIVMGLLGLVTVAAS